MRIKIKHSIRKFLPYSGIFLFVSCTQAPAQVVLAKAPFSSYSNFSVSSSKASPNPYKIRVQPGQTLYTIAKKYDLSLRELIDTNDLRPPYFLTSGQALTLPKPMYHVVQAGDTLYRISRGYGVDMSRLVRTNHLTEPYLLAVGKKLRLSNPTNDFADNYDEAAVLAANIPTAPPAPPSFPFYDPTPHSIAAPATTAAKDLSLSQATAHTSPTYPFYDPTNMSHQKNIPQPVLRDAPIPVQIASIDPVALPATTATTTTVFSGNHASAFHSATHIPPMPPAPPASSQATSFVWPVKGEIISSFGPKKGGLYNDGINISTRENTPVRSAADGTVVYSGNELKGYGNLVLIKHTNGYLTAYAHNKTITVKKGETVKQGQTVAFSGKTGNVDKPQLHFSLRKGRKALNPIEYL